jgi:hypothetical protein
VETGAASGPRVFEPVFLGGPKMWRPPRVLRERDEGSAPEWRIKIVTMT